MRLVPNPVRTALTLLLFASASAVAGEESKDDAKASKDESAPRRTITKTEPTKQVSPYAAAARAARERKAVTVITTEDLETKFSANGGFSSFNSDGIVNEDRQQPLDYVDRVNQERTDRAANRAEAQAAVDAAGRRVAELEKQLLGVKNPFAARAELSEEDREARQRDASVAASISRIEGQLAEARAELSAAQRRLATGAPAPGPDPASAPKSNPQPNRQPGAPADAVPVTAPDAAEAGGDAPAGD